ncbi:hypothetical protein [Parasitella parasitica]|uniref:BHLH domain-containing protein n=1 Tax=Parasitella parasitica TaxID=35722 RepID=A0A0B7NUY3_9FUNG|nr:hypothetical protein [Parasitella parasitica]
MPPPPSKKRKTSIDAAPPQPAPVALPPPLIPYPPPHLMHSYYTVYHQHPYFLSVGPPPPTSPSLSPTLSSTSSTTATTTAPMQRILPKSPTSKPISTTAAVPTSSLAPSYNLYPYPIQISPQLHPTVAASVVNASPVNSMAFGIRHDSVSSTTSNSTADQREQARKISHSAIERRRRERINDKILRLRDLIPSCAEKENLHKMTILQSAIDYITYLKKVIEDSPTLAEDDNSMLKQPLQPKSTLFKAVDQSTKQYSGSEMIPTISKFDDKQSVESEDDTKVLEYEENQENPRSMSTSKKNGKADSSTNSPATPLPCSALKPMDLIKLNKPFSPPEIIIGDSPEEEREEAASFTHTERNMNLENILC